MAQASISALFLAADHAVAALRRCRGELIVYDRITVVHKARGFHRSITAALVCDVIPAE
jgi:hypothetical protein